MKLNPKAKWTDGQPVTADDVLFTVRTIGNPKVPTFFMSGFSMLEGFDDKGYIPDGIMEIPGMKKVNDYTLEFKTKWPIDPNLFKEKFGNNLKPLPKHILQDIDPEKLAQHPFMQKPDVTNGSFKLVAYEKNQYLEFAANPDYFKGRPKLDKLFFKIMPPTSLLAALQNGDIDMNFPGGGGNIPIEDFDKVKGLSNIRTESGKPFLYQALYLNTKSLPDLKVRQAIAYALDRKLMVGQLLKGEGEVTDGPYVSSHPYYKKDVMHYEHDPAKAKKLLEEAGWDVTKTLNFIVPNGQKAREAAADIVAANLKEVGVKAQIQKVDIPTAVQKGKKGEYDLLVLNPPFNYDPDLSMYFMTNGSNNFSMYSNPEIDDLLVKGTKEADISKRRVMYDQIQDVLAADLPQIPLYSDYRLKAISKRVKAGQPKEQGTLLDVHEWDVNE